MEIKFYTAEIHKSLLDFMIAEYPNRDPKYLEWWLCHTKNATEEEQKRTFVITDKGEIIACTTADWTRIKIKDSFHDFYWEANTIVSPKYRGQGVGRMIFEQMDLYRDRCTTGFTDIAYKLQLQIIKHFKRINPVYVYLTFNRYCFKSFFCPRQFKDDLSVNERICYKSISAELISSSDQLEIPDNGIWINDEIELIRDERFIKKRFFNIYKKYFFYKINEKDKCVGYFVVRNIRYHNISMLSLVDYRYTDKKYLKYILSIANIIARKNKIGFVLSLTSQVKIQRLIPFTIFTGKELYGGTTMPELKDGQEFLITSADSDLDFVYYK